MNAQLPVNNRVSVFLTRCSSISDEQAKHYWPLLSERERERNLRYRFARDRHRDLVARALLRTTLGSILGIDPAALKIGTGEKGKPFICEPEFSTHLPQFNLSHSGDWVVLVVAWHLVGIDVEYTERTNDVLAIASHYFYGAEIEELFSFPAAEQPDRFFDYWTLKEAYMKARGEGIALGLSNFGFSLKDNIALYLSESVDDNPEHWQFCCITPEPNYRVAIASNTLARPEYIFWEVIPQVSTRPLHWLV